jgi:transposase
MNKPVLSLDVSKNSSYAATYLALGEPLDKPFSIPHSPQGLTVLLERLKTLERLTGKKPDVILESTGNYSKPISLNLREAGYSVIILNPLQTHTQKHRSIRKVKTDPVDAKRIAELYYLQKFTYHQLPKPQIAELRNLCRQYEGFNILHTETQLRYQSILELLFPCYVNVFTHLNGDNALRVIAAFPTPEDVLSASRVEVIKHINPANQKKFWVDEKYQKLVAAARSCLPYKVAQQSNVRVLKEYVRLLMTQKKILTDVRAQIAAAANDIPAYSLLLSIPGVGPITAATILSEIEDVSRFPTVKQLVAYAGLDASVCESGKFKASNNKISKRGSGYLRKALFQAASAGVRRRKTGPSNPIMYEYYSRKVAEGKSKMVALIATSNKLLRIIYGMWHNNETFKLS